jgi:hypothetical protein
MNPDRLAELEEQRRFLLRSLADLEREHAAGDVDEVDYGELRDGYTVRTAATLRAIEEGRAALPPQRRVAWWRRAVWVVGAAAVVALVSVVLVNSSAERGSDGSGAAIASADPVQRLLSEARIAGSPRQAADTYAEVLAIEPDNVEALTYRGWMLAIDAAQSTDPSTDVVAQLREAIDSLFTAARLDPSYPDPACFLGIINFNFLQLAVEAKPWVDECLASNPPAEVRGLVEGLQARVDAALAAVPTTAPSTAPSTTAPGE